ncbi:uda-1, partial [Pristionchus pacificus]|uniref:Uda-1 n=1 Tax=Pristionchus pacificus TaxID=54126 RepID=A0A2A6C067_PRIPA
RGETETSIDDEGYYCYGDGHLHTSQPCRFFAIVIDAGSTGTRLQLFRFVHSTTARGLPFHAEEETFHEVKPGLSSFVGRPHEAAASVQELLATAISIVPLKLRGRTPIVLKATAGLRLLPGDAAQRILEYVNTTVRSSGFVCLNNCVGILDGTDEGVFSWFTLNLLLARFYHDSKGNEVDPSPARSAAAFDLGGGSTQVTYWPSSGAMFDAHPSYRHDIDFFQSHMHLYTHSYLGLGLQSARLGVLQGAKGEKEGLELESPCFPPSFVLPKWEQALKEWSVRGSPEYSLRACQQTTTDFVRRSEIGKLTDLRGSSHLYFFSYFYERARQAGLVGEGETKAVRVKQWRDAAEKACSTSSFPSDVPHWLPWACLDLSYIHALLKDGYGFDDDQEIIPVNSISGMGVSWALGSAYSLVDEFHRELALEDIEDDVIRDQRSSVNATGVELVDSFLTVLSQKTTDVLAYFNLVS